VAGMARMYAEAQVPLAHLGGFRNFAEKDAALFPARFAFRAAIDQGHPARAGHRGELRRETVLKHPGILLVRVRHEAARETIDDKTRSSKNFFNGKGRTTDECLIIIFGGSGDLAKRKLFPALGNLMLKKLLPEKFKIVAVGRKPMETKDLLSMAKYPTGFEKN